MSLSNDRATSDHRHGVADLTEPFAALAFWSAIALPVLYVPLLAAALDATQDLLLLLGLLVLHLGALVGGRSHGSR